MIYQVSLCRKTTECVGIESGGGYVWAIYRKENVPNKITFKPKKKEIRLSPGEGILRMWQQQVQRPLQSISLR